MLLAFCFFPPCTSSFLSKTPSCCLCSLALLSLELPSDPSQTECEHREFSRFTKCFPCLCQSQRQNTCHWKITSGLAARGAGLFGPRHAGSVAVRGRGRAALPAPGAAPPAGRAPGAPGDPRGALGASLHLQSNSLGGSKVFRREQTISANGLLTFN